MQKKLQDTRICGVVPMLDYREIWDASVHISAMLHMTG